MMFSILSCLVKKNINQYRVVNEIITRYICALCVYIILLKIVTMDELRYGPKCSA